MSLFKRRSQTPEPEPVAEPSPKPGGKGRPTPRRIGAGIALVLGGFAVVVAGVAIAHDLWSVLVGLVGFALAVWGITLMLTGPSRPADESSSPARGGRSGGSGADRPRSRFMQRQAERWEHRRDH